MSMTSLAELKRDYSSALYSYFRVTNLQESFKEFLKDPAQPPVFHYSSNTSLGNASRRLSRLRQLLAETDPSNESEIAFIEWRIAEMVVLKKFLNIRQRGDVVPKLKVEDYIESQVELYGALDERIFGGIVRYIRILAHRRGEVFSKEMDNIEKRLGFYPKAALFSPKEETFLHYKHLFADCFPELHHVLNKVRNAEEYPLQEVTKLFEQALGAVGADDKGWRVVTSKGGANVISSKYSKRVVIGESFRPHSSLRLKQIIAHEVGTHVQRALTDRQATQHASLEENDEGLAIMLEQLLAKRFMYKRAMRYLAIGLALGLDGNKRDFSEVYDILWRAAFIIGGDKKKAKEQAFYETARAFRGGLPGVPGMVYIKDKIYLEGNIIVWQKLEENQLSLEEFRRLFRGHNNKLAREIVP